MRLCLFAVVALSALASAAEKQPFERYQSIIDRQMFGRPPRGFDPDKMPSEVSRTSDKELTAEQEKLQSALHFSVINVTEAGEVEVGFTDNSDPKAPAHYFLKVGESQNGWEVVEADPENATMTVVKDDIEVSLSLGDNSANGGGTTSAKGASSVPSPSAPSSSSAPSVAEGPRSPGLLGGIQSLRGRRQQRMEQLAKERAEQKAADDAKAAAEKEEREAREAEAKAEREANREQLRALQEELRRSREQREQQHDNGNEGNETDDAQ